LDAILRKILSVKEMRSKGAFKIGVHNKGAFRIRVRSRSALGGAQEDKVGNKARR
jgi:hypothetical protein